MIFILVRMQQREHSHMLLVRVATLFWSATRQIYQNLKIKNILIVIFIKV